MEKEFEKNLMEFIILRCSDALKNSDEYLKLQSEECDRDELLDIALTTGYKKGASDMLKIVIRCSQNL